MAVQYFGKNDTGNGTGAVIANYSNRNDNVNIVYTCPGSGAQNLVELGCYGENALGNVRVAIYDTSRNLIAQGATELAAAADTWITHTTFTDSAGDPVTPQLTGGTAYLLAVTGDGTAWVGRDAVTAGYMKYTSNDYTGGWPSSLAAGSNSGSQFCVRCGVEAAAGGGEAYSGRGIARGIGRGIIR